MTASAALRAALDDVRACEGNAVQEALDVLESDAEDSETAGSILHDASPRFAKARARALRAVAALVRAARESGS